MKKSKILNTIRLRAKYYIIGYLAGYVFSLLHCGFQNLYVLIPIKLIGIATALMGTVIYYRRELKLEISDVMPRMFKYYIPILAIVFLGFYLKDKFKKIGIDITLLIGY